MPSQKDFAKQFAEMSDLALLEINREDLVDVAKTAYDLEMEDRGLEAEEAEAAAEPHGDDLVSVAEFESAGDAQRAVDLLRKNRVPAYIAITVPEAFARQAVNLLDPGVPDDELEALATSTGMPEEEK